MLRWCSPCPAQVCHRREELRPSLLPSFQHHVRKTSRRLGLQGDQQTFSDGIVNSADIGQTKAQSGQSVNATNFREDLNGDGFINSADIGLVKSKSGTGLPK